MATVERRQQRAGGPVTYRVRWRDDAGDQKSKTFARRRDADQWRTKVEHDLLSGTYVNPQAGRIKFAGYAEQWFEAQVWADTTRANVRRALDLHLLPLVGDRPIGALRAADLRTVSATLSRDLAASTASVYFGYLVAILATAADDRVIPVNPARTVKRPKVVAAQVVPPTAHQVGLLLEHCPARHRALLLVLAGLGLRVGEALGLTVDRVDFLGRAVRIDRQAQPVQGQGVVLLPRLKTKASYRTIPLPDSVGQALAHHIKTYGTGDDGVLFPGPSGRPVGRGTARAAIHAAASTANEAARRRDRKAPAPFPEMFHPHDLRHFYASALIAAGCSVKTVQARLGDASAAITLDVYGHLWPDNEEQTRTAVDDLLGPVASVWPESAQNA